MKVPDLRRRHAVIGHAERSCAGGAIRGSLPDLVDVPFVGKDRLRVGRRDTAWPRAFFVDGVSTYTDTADLFRQATARGKPFGAVQSSDFRAVDPTRSLAPPSGEFQCGLRLQAYGQYDELCGSRDRLHCGAGRNFSSGRLPRHVERATCPILRINHAFKAVRIPSVVTGSSSLSTAGPLGGCLS